MKRTVLIPMCAAALAALLCRPSPALAQAQAPSASADAHAKEAFKKGEALFRAGRYLEALAQFSGGYELSQRPLFLFNMGECARKLGQTERARAYYERYVAADKAGKLVPLAEQRIAELGGRAEKEEREESPAAGTAAAAGATAPAAGKTAPDTAPDATAPDGSAPAPAGGTGTTANEAVPAAMAEPPRSVPAAALQADAPPEEEPRPLWKKWPFWAAVGAAAVTATAVVYATSSGGAGGCSGTCVDFR